MKPVGSVWNSCTTTFRIGRESLSGGLLAERAIDVREMTAIQPVKIGPVGRIVFGTVPPAPVAALGNHDLFERQAPVLFGHALCILVRLPRIQQALPGLIVLFGANPHVEIRVDPGARKNVIQWFRRDARQRLVHRQRVHILGVGDPPV